MSDCDDDSRHCGKPWCLFLLPKRKVAWKRDSIPGLVAGSYTLMPRASPRIMSSKSCRMR